MAIITATVLRQQTAENTKYTSNPTSYSRNFWLFITNYEFLGQFITNYTAKTGFYFYQLYGKTGKYMEFWAD